MALSDVALLAKFSCGKYSGQKIDRDVTSAVLQHYSASVDAGQFVKFLFEKGEFKEIDKVLSDARSFHNENTSPWDGNGTRLLSSKNYKEYRDGMDAREKVFRSAVEVFLDRYDDLVERSKDRLGSMKDQGDYLTKDQVRDKFSFDVSFFPVPDASDFKVSLIQESERESIKAGIESHLKKAQAEATRDLWSRLYGVVDNLATRLSDPEAIFKKNTLLNIADLLDLLPKLNMDDDPALIAAMDEVSKKLLTHDAETLRSDPVVRKEVATAATKIAAGIGKRVGLVTI